MDNYTDSGVECNSHLKNELDSFGGIPFYPPLRDTPYCPYTEVSSQFRVKIQRFTPGGFEATLVPVDVQRVARAIENGLYGLPRKVRDQSTSQDSEDCIERSKRRSKTKVRYLCKEIGADKIATFTTRLIYSVDDLASIWAIFRRLAIVAMGGEMFRYVAVLEFHQDGKHLHIHCATSSFLNFALIRRIWQTAIVSFMRSANLAGASYSIPSNFSKSNSPGNVQVEIKKKTRGVNRVARYISKYITKDSAAEFNKKRYWSNRISLSKPEKIWLRSVTYMDAVNEMLGLFGMTFQDVVAMKSYYANSEASLLWFEFSPDTELIPPF